MRLTLAENIRALRRQRKLTQEQLAEVLGVTTGAVYKWESGLSAPELTMLVELADFFDCSVDALLGYLRKDNRLEETERRIGEYCRNLNPEAMAEAEKLLKKYPNSFRVVHRCAQVYSVFGAGNHGERELRRALELLEQSRLLIAQNTEPEISEQTICGEIAVAWLQLGEGEKGIELLKKHNAGGLFNDAIGTNLAIQLHRPDEAEPFLTAALLRSMATLLDSVAGFAYLYRSRGDHASERQIIEWGLGLLEGVKKEGAPDYLDKIHAELFALRAAAQSKAGEQDGARVSMEQAAALVRRFDAAPDFGLGTFRFAEVSEFISVHDYLGATAKESVERLLRDVGDPAMDELWKEAGGHE